VSSETNQRQGAPGPVDQPWIATVQNGGLILIKWLSSLVGSHALVIAGLFLAVHETLLAQRPAVDRHWSWAAAIDHFFGSGEAAILSVTLTATALVSLVWRRKEAGRPVVIFCLVLFFWVFVPPLVWPDVLLGKADVGQARDTSVILIVIGAGLGGAAECILGSTRLEGGQNVSA
jgi:hypothetical protein